MSIRTSIRNTRYTAYRNQYRHQASIFLTEINNNKEHIIKVIERLTVNNYRKKRGIINLVGRTANILFGVCDDADSNYFYNKIKELEESKHWTTHVLDSQIRILKSIISNVNSSLIQAEKDQEILADKYNSLLHEVLAEKLELGIINFKIALEERIALLNLILIQYSFETANLEILLTRLYMGLYTLVC